MSKLNPAPNKETVRRICSIFKCNTCWLLNRSGQLSVLVKLDTKNLPAFKQELESWSGCMFNVYNFESPEDSIQVIQTQGEQLLPINLETAMYDVEMRRKHNHRSN